MKARDVFSAVFGRSKLLPALGVVIALVLPAAALGDTLPAVSGEEASEVGVTTVKLSGQVNPNGTSGDGNTTWRLQWSPAGTDHGAEGEEGWNFAGEGTIEAPASEEANPVGVEAMVGFGGELQPGQEYEFRLQAENGAGQAETVAPYPTFTMDAPVTPVLAAEPASSISIASAHLSGTVDPEGGNVNPIGPEAMPIHWELQYSADGSSWNTAGSGDITGAEAEGTTPIEVQADATGLTAATEYQVRLHAYTNSPTFALFVEADSPGPNPAFTTDAAVEPVLTLEPAEGVTSDSAHISGTIDPEGGNEDAVAGLLPIAWELQVNKDEEGWNTVGSGELTGADAESEDPIAVEADATGLVPNAHYQYRLVVRYAGLQKETPEGELGVFDTPATAPSVERATLFNPTPTSIRLRAEVNPHNAALTDCHFEYGTNGVLDHSAPCDALPAGNSFTTVAADVSDLVPATEYEFRLVATNAADTTEGDVRTFTSLEEPAPETCPNEAIREAQHSTHLPECRAWEMVSPLAKGNGDIIGDGGTNVASVDGDAVTLSTRTPFGDTIGSGVSGQTQYVARRSPSGWSAHSITPQPRADEYQTFFGATRFQAYSDDLSTGVVSGYDFPAATGDLPLRNNIYVEDLATRALRPVTMLQNGMPDPLPHPINDNSGQDANWGLSADAMHVAFVSRAGFLPEAAPGVPNVYQWDDGVLSLAGVLPDGTTPPGGSDVVAQADVPVPNYRRSMSADGARLLFMASLGGSPQLFQRIDGSRTEWISESELDPSAPGYQPYAAGVRLQAATPDGRNVLFTTDTPLLNGDTNGTSDLYRWTDSPDPSSDANLERITPNGFTEQVVGVSDDGKRVYWHTLGNELRVWNDGDARLIVKDIRIASTIAEKTGADGWGPGYGRVSPNGKYLTFLSYSSSAVPGNDVNPIGDITNGKREVYLYSLADDTLRCLSCPVQPASADATVKPEVTGGVITYTMPGIRPRFLSDSGKVFFSTAEELVPTDVNGVADAYTYDPVTGKLSLVSSGRGKDPANFTDASPSGDDVFLVTRQQLVDADTDDLVDLYDVRVAGGFPETPVLVPSPCGGDDCQSAGAPAPGTPGVSSHVVSRGNIHQHLRHRCGKHPRNRARHGKAHCGKKKKQGKKHRHRGQAKTDRREGR